MDEKKKHLAFSILEFLQKSCQDGTIKADDTESMEVAMQCIGETFGVNIEDPEQQKLYSTKPATLLTIFDVFLKTQSKLKSTPAESSANTLTTESNEKAAPPALSEEEKKKAEELKAAGNKKVTERNYPEAIKLYSEAIAIDGNNAVYYANRAAAYSQQGDYQRAVEDSEKALEIDPKYSKAYSRLGHAHYCLSNYEEAVNAYEKGLELDPNNSAMKQSLQTARSKLPSSTSPSTTREAEAASPFGGAGGPGGFDFASLMNNPALMQMAQQMMQSGAMNDILGNPQMAQMAEQYMRSGRTPSMEDLMSNPELMNMARQFMGGAGRGAGGRQ
ncbi:uncharacterized protein VTP21DRAFT_2527 [Calcarisporiella thermophila]|uniref:uncharacterized protein n=1 Tax=Calcarisporiella thermophila TaxID=911321 RepID=UPI00374273A3